MTYSRIAFLSRPAAAAAEPEHLRMGQGGAAKKTARDGLRRQTDTGGHGMASIATVSDGGEACSNSGGEDGGCSTDGRRRGGSASGECPEGSECGEGRDSGECREGGEGGEGGERGAATVRAATASRRCRWRR